MICFFVIVICLHLDVVSGPGPEEREACLITPPLYLRPRW